MNIHPTAIVDPKAQIAPDVEIGPYTVISGEVQVGSGTVIGPFCLIGEPKQKLVIGQHCIIRSHTVIYADSELGNHVQTGHRATIRSQCAIGNHCTIGTGSDLQGSVIMGQYSRLHSDVHLCQGARIGNYVFVYPRVTFTNDRYPPSLSTTAPEVGDYAQIGAGTMLMPGIRVGKHCLVAANSLVNANFDDGSFIKGSPAKRIGLVTDLKQGEEELYPWPNRFDRNMPWQGIDFDQWTEDAK